MIQVRQATIDDLGMLVPLFDSYRVFYAQQSDVALAHAFLMARFEHLQSVIFLAEDQGDALGFVQFYPSFSSARAARILILNDLFVRPDARGRGVASKLLERAGDYGRSIGAVRLSLSTAVDNISAQGLYERAGWERDTQFLSYNLPLS